MAAVVTMLPNADIVSDFLFGGHAIASRLTPQSLLIDCSTIGPVSARELHGQAKDKGLTFVDAPVSGGVKGAEDGKLTFMMGSENNEVFEVLSQASKRGVGTDGGQLF